MARPKQARTSNAPASAGNTRASAGNTRASAGNTRGAGSTRGSAGTGQATNGARAGKTRPATPPGEGTVAAAPAGAGVPRWLRLSTLILSLAGLGLSIYLTIAHYTQSALAGCPANATFNCGKVTTSPESIIFGIFPVAVLGLAYYVFMVAINSPWAWRSDRDAIRWIRLAGIITGIVFVLYLVYVELLEVDAICEYCTGVHIITFLLFGLIMYSVAARSTVTGKATRR